MDPNPFSSPETTPDARKNVPSPSAAVAIFGAALVLNLGVAFLFSALEWNEDWLLVSTPLLLIALTATAVLMVGADVRETLLLRAPTASDVLMAFPLALSLVVLNDQLSTLTQSLVPLPEELAASLNELLRIETTAEWLFKLGTIGLGAAVSEELLFRGFIQNAFLAKLRRAQAIVWTAFLFMLLHTLPLPSFAAAGVVLGIAAVGARSIAVPIVVHAVNNVSTLALVNLGGLETLADPIWIPPEILLPALAIFAISIGHFLRRMPEAAPAFRDASGTHPSPEPPEADPETVSVDLPKPSLRDELAGVSIARRRLGWLVVVLSVVLGFVVLVGLIGYSVYSAQPERVQGSVIEALEQLTTEQLTPDARPRAQELEQAFASLAQANDRRELPPERLWDVLHATARLTADAHLDDREVDELLAVIRHASGTTGAPRRL